MEWAELAGQTTRLRRDWTLFVLLPGLLRLCLIGSFSLCEDEAYYWEWSRNLALGYHDQGPGVAVAIWLGTALFGDNEFGVRFPAAFMLTGALSFAFLLLREMYGRRASLFGAVALNVVPVFALGSLLMLHEAVQAFFWSFALYAFWRAVKIPSPSRTQATLWWILAGFGLGLAFNGKYTAILFAPAALLFLRSGADDRSWFARPQPYVAAFAAFLTTLPLLFWNHQNEWRSVSQVLSLGRPGDALLQPRFFLELVATQFGVVSPILFGLMIWRLVAIWKRGVARTDRRERFLFFFTLVYAAPFFILALHSRIYPNWPCLGYLTGIMLVAGWAGDLRAESGFARAAALRWWQSGLALAGGISLLLILHLTLQLLPIPGNRDPAKRFYGWSEMARWAESLAAGYARSGQPVHYYAKTYQIASLLAFYVPGQPRVFEVKDWDRPNQYDYWDDLPPGADALLVIHRNEPLPQIALRTFQSVEEIDGAVLEIERHGGIAQTFRAYHCVNYRPEAQGRDAH